MISPLPLPVTVALGKLPATPTLPDLCMKGQPVSDTFILTGLQIEKVVICVHGDSVMSYTSKTLVQLLPW